MDSTIFINQRVAPHFVGREEALQELGILWQFSLEGQGRLVFIAGEPGIGKTTFVEKFLSNVKELQTNVGIVHAKCSEIYGEDLPFFPFREALKELLTTKDKHGKIKKNKLYDFVKDIGGAWLGLIPIVGDIAKTVFETGMGIKDNLLKNSKEQKTEMFGSFLSILEKATKDQALILFFDDLHWSDRSSIELLLYLSRLIDNYPLLIIATYRPHEIEISRGEQLHPLKVARVEMCRYRLCHEIQLNLLDISECSLLLDSVFSNNQFPYSFKELIFNKTEGNPLFINEILLFLEDKRIISKDNSHWVLSEDLHDIEIPGTLEEIINIRFQKIEDELKKYLKFASIEGEEFSSIVLSGLLKIEDEFIIFDRMEQAEKTHQMVLDKGAKEFPQGETTQLYSFSHKLFHKIIYKNLNEKQKELLHRKVGEILESKYTAYENEISPELARHFEIGRSFEKAVKYYEIASAQAQSLHSYEDVLINCQRGLKILEKMRFPEKNIETRILFLLKIGQASERLSRWDEGLKNLEQALELCQSPTFQSLKANVELYIGWIKFDQGCWDEAKDYIEESLGLFEVINDLEGKFFALNRLGLFYEKKCEWNQAYQLYEHCLKIAEKLDQKRLIATSYGDIGDIFELKNEWDKALVYYEKERELARETNDLPELSRASFNIGLVYKNKGDWDRAFELFTESKTILEKLKDLSAIATRLRHLGDVAEKKGEWQQAQEYYTEAKKIYEKIGDKEGLADALNDLGWLYSFIGRCSESLKFFEEVLAISDELGGKKSKSSAYNNIGLIYYDMGELDKALEYLEKSMKIDEEIGDEKGMGRSYNNIGLIYFDKGDMDKALEYFEKDQMIAQKLGDKWGLSTSYCNMGLIYFTKEELDRASEFYEADLKLVRKLGDKAGEALALTNMGGVYIEKGLLEEAYKSLAKSEILLIQCGDKYTLIETYCSLAKLNLRNKDFDSALEFCNKGLKMSEDIGRKEMIAENYNLLGKIYQDKGNWNLASEYYHKAIEIVETSIKRLLPKFYKNLGSLYEFQGNPKQALDYYQKSFDLYGKMNAPVPMAELKYRIEKLSG